MATLLSGKEVVKAMKASISTDVAALKEQGITPKLMTIRVGDREDDISYETGATKRAKTVGVEVESVVLAGDATQDELIDVIKKANADLSVHGVLLFRPLPKHIDDNAARQALLPAKDIDGITDSSMIGTYTGSDIGFNPCTPQACIEILDHYGIDLSGKNITVVGRSLVVGKPAALMLMKRNSTVTVCHTRTKDMQSVCKKADILIVSAGRAGIVNGDYVSPGQVVIDVGINVNDQGKLCGDVDFDSVSPIVDAITPVPGGVGTVTTSVLIKNVVNIAKRTLSSY